MFVIVLAMYFPTLKNKENKSGPEIFILLQQLMSDKKYVS